MTRHIKNFSNPIFLEMKLRQTFEFLAQAIKKEQNSLLSYLINDCICIETSNDTPLLSVIS